MKRAFCSTLFVFLASSCILGKAKPMPVGTGDLEFKDSLGNADRSITVFYHRPEKFTKDRPVLVVMHGVKRNGDYYRDAWIKYADKYNVLLIAPQFSNENYPGGRNYNLGNLYERKGKLQAKNKWAFSAIEHLFDYVVRENDLSAKEYYLYGHSAGGQFVHRMVLFLPEARFKVAIAANPGWYTMPTLEINYPHGLNRSPSGNAKLKRAFARRLIVLLGEEDTDPNGMYLPKTPKTMAQGPHRYARGNKFFSTATDEAKSQNVELNWKKETVPKVGHSNAGMAGPAAKLMFSTN